MLRAQASSFHQIHDLIPCLPGGCSGVRVEVVRLESNCGPAAARNAGLWAVRKLGVQLACFLDADCMPEVGTVCSGAVTRAPLTSML